MLCGIMPITINGKNLGYISCRVKQIESRGLESAARSTVSSIECRFGSLYDALKRHINLLGGCCGLSNYLLGGFQLRVKRQGEQCEDCSKNKYLFHRLYRV